MPRLPRLLRFGPLVLGLCATLGVAVLFAVAPANTDVLGQTAPMFRDEDDDRVLVPGEPLEGFIRPPGDVDTYFFDGVEGQTIRLTLSAETGNLLPVVELRTMDDEILTEVRIRENPRGPDRAEATLEFTLPKTDTYKVVVWGLDRSVGRYTLLLEIVEPETES